MTVTAAWDNLDKTILLYEFEGHWTWDELHNAVNQARELLDQVEHQVDVIVDLEKSRPIPSNAVVQFRRLSNIQTDRMRLRVVVGGNGMATALMNIFNMVYRHVSDNYRVATTRDQAYIVISSERAKRSSV